MGRGSEPGTAVQPESQAVHSVIGGHVCSDPFAQDLDSGNAGN